MPSINLIISSFFVVLWGSVSSLPPQQSSHTIDATKELLLTSVLFRHGARTPINSYPNDPHNNQTFLPWGIGQLTNEGKMYLFKSGQWLRTRYGDFLNETYSPLAVWAQSTDSDRTKMSLALVLAGLFPPKASPLEWNTELNWQPIPMHSQPTHEDALLVGRSVCPRYFEALDEVLKSPEILKLLDDNALLMSDLARYTGQEIRTPHDIEFIQDTFNVQHEYGLQLPEEAKKFFPHTLENLAELAFMSNIYTDELKQIRGGPFVEMISTAFDAKRDNSLVPKERKISLFAAHDYTMVNVLETFGIRNGYAASYGIMALFELLRDKNTNELGVQIFLRISETSGAIPLTIPGCENFCPLDHFLKIMKKFIPESREKLCKVRNPNYVPPLPKEPIFSL